MTDKESAKDDTPVHRKGVITIDKPISIEEYNRIRSDWIAAREKSGRRRIVEIAKFYDNWPMIPSGFGLPSSISNQARNHLHFMIQEVERLMAQVDEYKEKEKKNDLSATKKPPSQ